jgi:hypothetical protein
MRQIVYFESRFIRRPLAVDFDGLYHGDLHVDRDTTISRAVEGSLQIDGSSHVLMSGKVDGSAHVAPEAVFWVEGLVEDRVYVEGAAFLKRAHGGAHGDHAAFVHDPCQRADSETG